MLEHQRCTVDPIVLLATSPLSPVLHWPWEVGGAFPPPFRRPSLLSILAWLFPCEGSPGSLRNLIMAVKTVQGQSGVDVRVLGVSSGTLARAWGSAAAWSADGRGFCNTGATLFVLRSRASFLSWGSGQVSGAPDAREPLPPPPAYVWTKNHIYTPHFWMAQSTPQERGDAQ